MSLALKFLGTWNSTIKEDRYAHPTEVAEFELNLIQLQSEVVDTWRWGSVIETVYTNNHENYIAVTYLETSGDSEIDALGRSVTAHDVVPQEVTTIKYVRV